MTAQLIGDVAPGSPEWHELRTRGIGGSEIAAVVGLSPYESAFSLWHKKRGNIEAGQSGEHLGWGNRLEPVICDYFAERHPEFVLAKAGTYVHGDRPWQLANVDRLLHNDGEPFPDNAPSALLEIKTSRYGDGFGKSGGDEIPLHYRCQVQHYLDVMELPYAWVAVLIGGNEYREYRIDYDPEDALALREAAAAFWTSLQNDDEPPIDASFETYEAVRELHPDIDPNLDVEIDPARFHEYLQLKEAAEVTAANLQRAKSELLHILGNARRALVAGSPVLRRQPGRGGSVSLYPVKEAS